MERWFNRKRLKNELVLEALERYLSGMPIVLGRFSMGDLDVPRRAEIYERVGMGII